MKQKAKLENKEKTRIGSALILTTILLFVILGMVVSLTYVTVMEQKMSGKTKSSVGSFYNAESGIEWALNKIASSSESDITGTFSSINTDGSVNCPASFGEDYCKVYLLDQDGNVIDDPTEDLSTIKAVRSVGTNQNETQRAIEAAVAGTSLCDSIGDYTFQIEQSDGTIYAEKQRGTGKFCGTLGSSGGKFSGTLTCDSLSTAVSSSDDGCGSRGYWWCGSDAVCAWRSSYYKNTGSFPEFAHNVGVKDLSVANVTQNW